MMILCKLERLTHWPGNRNPKHIKSQFKASYVNLLADVVKELSNLSACLVTLKLAIRDEDVPSMARQADGWPLASAKTYYPGVVLRFDCTAGLLQFCCDRYVTWQENLRAICLTLEALRNAGRHGATSGFMQYRGFRYEPPSQQQESGQQSSTSSVDAVIVQAAHYLASFAVNGSTAFEIMRKAEVFKAVYRELAFRYHPDRLREDAKGTFVKINQAADTLKQHHGL